MWQKVDFLRQLVMTSSVGGPRRSSKALPKAKLAPKKVMVTVWWSAASLTHYFWIPVKLSHLRSTLSKSMRCTRSCNTCSKHWSKERAQCFSRTMPNCTPHNQRFKGWKNWATKFCLICHIHLTSCPLLQASWQLFVGKMLSPPAGGRKCFPRVQWILKNEFLCYRNKQTYFSLAKICWL